ncbi:MAG: LicD family protein [Ruminococcaceae bacterium]|nr:LicD family protein [Oscillospiraceae bacterium]
MKDSYGLHHIHDGLFEIMIAIDDLCEKHGIGYFLDSGTLLGAVRHQDFIPWDDDADLAMTRDNFEKFCAVAHELPAPFRFVLPTEYNGYFFDFVPRIINTEFPLREETEADKAQNNYQNRLAVDIFLMDRAPDDPKKFSKMVFRQKMIYGYAMAHRYDKHAHEHGLADKIKILVLTTLGRFQKLDKILKKQEALSASYRNETVNRYCITNAIMKEIHNSYPLDCITETVKFPIRDRSFPCPAGYDTILTALYGDYMTPPPENDRIPIHTTVTADTEEEA